MAADTLVPVAQAGALVMDRGGHTALDRIAAMQTRMSIITAVMANVLVEGRHR